MSLKFNRLLSILLLAVLVISGCGSKSDTTLVDKENYSVAIPEQPDKPSQITMMVDGTLVDAENGQAEFEAKWEELTGIDLVIIQPGHDVYSDEVTKAFDSLELPDVILLNSTFYTKYAEDDMLCDITPYYQGSQLEARIKAAGKENLINAIKIDGKLFGITPTRGNGCVTYNAIKISEMLKSVEEASQNIENSMNDVSNAMNDVATAVDESARGIGDIAGAVNLMSENMNESTEIVNENAEIAQQLDGEVNKFKF